MYITFTISVFYVICTHEHYLEILLYHLVMPTDKLANLLSQFYETGDRHKQTLDACGEVTAFLFKLSSSSFRLPEKK